jgi:flagellar M-ring protein FliF
VNDTLGQYKERILLYWNQLSKTQKYMVVGIIATLIVTIVILTMNLSKTEYSTAFTNLQPGDAAAIKGYLDQAKIPYELSADGRTIGVPRNMVASVKLDVESQGLNKSGNLGYGVFGEKSAFGTTDQEFNVKYINAVQGEIQSMFNQINGVNSSKVLITIPKPTAFVAMEKQDSSAAVVLNLAPGYRFEQAQIDTMYHLVAKSIPDLRSKYENITISDQNGELLPYSKSGSGVGIGDVARINEQFQIKKQFETDIQKKVQQILGGILGPNKVISVVTASMNFDSKSVQSQLVRPVVDSQGIDISIQEIEKTYSSEGGAQNGGVPGTGDSDVPGYQAAGSTGNSKSEEISRTVNREVDRITESVAKAPYAVKDLAINVGIEPPVRDDPASLNPETVNAIRQILVSIVSASLADSEIVYTNEQLAQKVTVLAQPFASVGAAEEVSVWNNPWLYGAGAAILLLGAGIGFIAFRRKREQLEEEAAVLAQQPAKAEFPTIDLESVSNESQVRKQLEMLAQKKPDEFVELLRTWLVEE